MTRRVRLLVLATCLTALLGAPSVVFGAAPTRLYDASVSPRSGTTSTLFTIRTQFDGGGKFTAGRVVATVGGKRLTLSRLSGTDLAGTWEARSTLPAGAWVVVFETLPDAGPSAALTGPMVRVSAATPIPTAKPTPTMKPTPTPSPSTTAGDGAPAKPDPTPLTAPAPGSPALPAGSSEPETATGGTAGDDSSDDGGAEAAPSSGGSNDNDRGTTREPDKKPVATSPAADRGGAGGSTDIQASGSPTESAAAAAPIDGSGTVNDGMVVYLIGAMAAVAAFGFFLVLARRRRDEEEPLAAAAAPTPSRAPAPLATRTIRRGRLEQANDPILESMGLNKPSDPPAVRRPTAAGEVQRGPGVREPQPRRR
jgi:hypothetical protein